MATGAGAAPAVAAAGAKWDAVVIGSGFGGLSAGAMLARYGKRVLVLESHDTPGGAAHGFQAAGYTFDTGPSFFCGMQEEGSLNPVKMLMDAIGETVEYVSYDKFMFHFPSEDVILPIYGEYGRYLESVAKISPRGAQEMQAVGKGLLAIYNAMQDVPTLAIRMDWKMVPVLFTRYPLSMAKMLPFVSAIQGPVQKLFDRAGLKDPFVQRLLDIECFLLSGLKADKTITAEIAFMFGERNLRKTEYPRGGVGAIVDAMVRGLERHGGTLRTKAHVQEIVVEGGRAVGVRLRSGERIEADVVVSNATMWDTYGTLLADNALPRNFRQTQMKTPAIESFMHLHLGIDAAGLDDLEGHHVVVLDSEVDIAQPGNTVMVSIASVWAPGLAPPGKHVVHAYTLEEFDGWESRPGSKAEYEKKKRKKAEPLFAALRKVIPGLDKRIEVCRIGTPFTHSRYLRRYQGSYGPAITAGEGLFPGPGTPISGLVRVGDSVTPGIGVPAVVGSGLMVANSLVSARENEALLRATGYLF